MRLTAPVFAVLAAVLSGCGAVQTVAPTTYQAPAISSEQKIETTYAIGEPEEAYVGEQMLRVQDFHVTVRETGSNSVQLSPTSAFTMKIPPFMSASFSSSDVMHVTGTTERDGKRYRVVQLPAAPAQMLRFLLNEDGTFQGSALNHVGNRMGWSYTPDPEGVRLLPTASRTSVDTSKGFVNFELVYSGTTGEAFQILYREYTKEDLARPAFSQTLVYEKGSTSIRFRNLEIDVHEASNERIKFTVVSDGSGSKSS